MVALSRIIDAVVSAVEYVEQGISTVTVRVRKRVGLTQTCRNCRSWNQSDAVFCRGCSYAALEPLSEEGHCSVLVLILTALWFIVWVIGVFVVFYGLVAL